MLHPVLIFQLTMFKDSVNSRKAQLLLISLPFCGIFIPVLRYFLVSLASME